MFYEDINSTSNAHEIQSLNKRKTTNISLGVAYTSGKLTPPTLNLNLRGRLLQDIWSFVIKNKSPDTFSDLLKYC